MNVDWMSDKTHGVNEVEIVTDNPGVFQLYLYPTLCKPLPSIKGKGYGGFG